MSPVFIVILSLIGIYMAVKAAMIAENRRHNRHNDFVYAPDGPMMFLTNASISRLRYGRKAMDWNGCEVIAVYHAKMLRRQRVSMAELVTRFQLLGAMWGWGYFGSSPASIGAVLKREGMAYAPVRSVGEMARPGIYIISYWVGKPWRSHLHTVTVVHDETGFTSYNVSAVEDHREPAAYVKDGFIRGYYLGK